MNSSQRPIDEIELYNHAAQLAETAMGRECVKPPGRRAYVTVLRADKDPLAWWCLTERIVALAKRGWTGQ